MVIRQFSNLNILLVLIVATLLGGCWNSSWTEQERSDFRKKCESQDCIDNPLFCFTGFDFDDIDTILIEEREGDEVIDSMFIYGRPERSSHDEKYQKFWGRLEGQINTNYSYDFYLDKGKPYTLHQMEIIMAPEYTMVEGWGCRMEIFSIDNDHFEDGGNVNFKKRGFTYPTDSYLTVEVDSTLIVQTKSGLSKYIDSLHTENWLIDTNRLNYLVGWGDAANSPKIMRGGNPVVLLAFPVDSFSNHFSNPNTYFFAKWDSVNSTFKNGGDFLLMTWEIDSLGIEKELMIYKSLTHIMGNSPCYCFRDGNRIYAMGHRQTKEAKFTLNQTMKVRDYITPLIPIYGYNYRTKKMGEVKEPSH